jgi:hypothetical protein
MNPSIFRPKELVENSVEKISRTCSTLSLLAPAKNAAPIETLPTNTLFSVIYEQPCMRSGLQQGLFVRSPGAAQTGRVLHKD